MKSITIRNKTGSWNEKIYKNNTIYLNNEKIVLTDEEVKLLTADESEAVKIARALNEAHKILEKTSIAGYKKTQGTSAEIEQVYNAIALLNYDVEMLKHKFFFEDYQKEHK